MKILTGSDCTVVLTGISINDVKFWTMLLHSSIDFYNKKSLHSFVLFLFKMVGLKKLKNCLGIIKQKHQIFQKY